MKEKINYEKNFALSVRNKLKLGWAENIKESLIEFLVSS